MRYTDVFAVALDRIDLDGSLVPGSRRNDLLPALADDNIGGEVAQNFVNALKLSIRDRTFDPQLAHQVPVPKSQYATRPATILSLADRVLYHALVEPLRPRIESRLISSTTLLWPRAIDTSPRWADFEHAPMTIETEYIVKTDISGFYESIDHAALRRRLVALTGRTEVVDALVELLERTMGQSRGIPQGLTASDVLATAYVSSVDATMLQHGFSYWRHGDDVRMAVQSHDEGRRAVFVFEGALRNLQLRINPEKTLILRSTTYDRQLRQLESERANVSEQLADLKRDGLLDADPDEIERLLEVSGIDEDTAFQVFYHHTMSIDEIADELEEHLEPNQVELATAMFENAVQRAPNSTHPSKLSRELFHGALSSSLTILIADKNAHAVIGSGDLILDFPDETEVICTYLRAVATTSPDDICAQVRLVFEGEFLLGWQLAWLLSVVFEMTDSNKATVPDDIVDSIRALMDDDTSDWIARVASARCLGRTSNLEHAGFLRLWGNSPAPLRSELADAICMQSELKGETGWESAFVDGLGSDPILQTVITRRRNRIARQKELASDHDADTSSSEA